MSARILVVCHANVARSLAAAVLLADAADERGEALEVRSAGTHATEGQPASWRIRGALVSAAPWTAPDATVRAHRAHLVSSSDLDGADLVVTMEASQVRFIRRVAPEAADRTATIGLLADALPDDDRPLIERIRSMGLAGLEPDDGEDVADPAGGDDSAYETTMRELAGLCERLAARLSGTRD